MLEAGDVGPHAWKRMEGKQMKTFLEKYPELLNLKEEEARVYGCLSRTGDLTASVISASCHIPYSQIHTILYRLQQEQLIVSRGSAPKLFALRFIDPAIKPEFEALTASVSDKTGSAGIPAPVA